MITIIDYGVGNLGSLLNMFRRIGVDACTTRDADALATASRILLPGIGAFDTCMSRFAESGLVAPLKEAIHQRGGALLGICVGMQMLTRRSEEGSLAGLGFIAADTIRIRQSQGEPKVPHMGWDAVEWQRESALTLGLEREPRFYFVHSYCVQCDSSQDVLGSCTYGQQFAAAIERENVRGVQFHPEKSHLFGMRLLENFASA